MAPSVFLVTKSEAHRVMAGSTDVDEKLKWRTVKNINEYIDNPNVLSYNKTFRIHNVFGWFGLPFLVFGVLSLVSWPGSIIKK
jgi:hypothetical protein